MKFDFCEDIDSSEENEIDSSRLEQPLLVYLCEMSHNAYADGIKMFLRVQKSFKREASDEKLAGVKCITLNKDFIILCINKTVLNRTIKDSLLKVLEQKPKKWPKIVECTLFNQILAVLSTL